MLAVVFPRNHGYQCTRLHGVIIQTVIMCVGIIVKFCRLPGGCVSKRAVALNVEPSEPLGDDVGGIIHSSICIFDFISIFQCFGSQKSLINIINYFSVSSVTTVHPLPFHF